MAPHHDHASGSLDARSREYAKARPDKHVSTRHCSSTKRIHPDEPAGAGYPRPPSVPFISIFLVLDSGSYAQSFIAGVFYYHPTERSRNFIMESCKLVCLSATVSLRVPRCAECHFSCRSVPQLSYSAYCLLICPNCSLVALPPSTSRTPIRQSSIDALGIDEYLIC